MNFEKAVRNINRSLNKKQPNSFNPQWIKNRCKVSYQFIVGNIKTEFDEPDWDLVVSGLDKYNQRLWNRGNKKSKIEFYKSEGELNVVLDKYKNKLYTFLWQSDKEDKKICDWISIRLVRIAQNGNILAREKLISLLSQSVNQWVESDKNLSSWNGYNDLMTKEIEGCISRFRYAGSFVGYLYRTLEYSGRGLTPIVKFSLDDFSPVTQRRRIETFYKK